MPRERNRYKLDQATVKISRKIARVFSILKVLVTGATGFVGAAVVRRFVGENHVRVRAVTRSAELASSDGAEWVVVPELNASTNWTASINGIDAIVHLAGRAHVMREKTPDAVLEFRRVNVDGTLRLARQAASAGVRRFVFLSSVKVNGERGTFRETDTPEPSGEYAVSKHEAELGLRQIARETGMEVVIIRPPLVYGPGVRANFRTLIRAVALGIPLPFGSTRNRRSFVGIDNLVDFVLTSMQHPDAANQTFFVSDGEDLSTPELIRHLARAMNSPTRLIPVPEFLLNALATLLGQRSAASRLLGSLQVDTSKARTLLGWSPPLSAEEGLRRAVVGT